MIPTHPRTGPSPDALEVVLSRNLVKAVVLIPTVNNPPGSIIPEENRSRLVAMIRKARVRVNFCGFSLTRGTLQVVVA